MEYGIVALLLCVVVNSNASGRRFDSVASSSPQVSARMTSDAMEEPTRFEILMAQTRALDIVKRKFNSIKFGNTTTATFSPGHLALAAPANFPQSPTDDDGSAPNVECTSDGRNCSCTHGYFGSPPDCHPGPQLWTACFKDNPCGPNSECEIDVRGTRFCSCMQGFVGYPPKCEPGPKYKSRCSKCGRNAECDDRGATVFCYCLPGFVGEYDSSGHLPNCTPGRQLLDRCSPYTYGAYADCHTRDGVCSCSCLPGYEGKPPDCRPGPELWRVCFKDRPCGPHSLCAMKNGAPMCMPCSDGYSGTPPFCYKP